MPDSPAVSIRVGGTVFRVRSSATAGEVERLATMVDERLRRLNPRNQPVTPQMFLLVAMAFAHDLESERATMAAREDELREEAARERARRARVEEETRAFLLRIVERIDLALDGANDALGTLIGQAPPDDQRGEPDDDDRCAPEEVDEHEGGDD